MEHYKTKFIYYFYVIENEGMLIGKMNSIMILFNFETMPLGCTKHKGKLVANTNKSLENSNISAASEYVGFMGIWQSFLKLQ